MKKCLVLLFLLFFSVSMFSQTINGVWKASLNVMGNTLDIYFNISEGDLKGTYSATLTVPTQGINNFKIDTVKFDGISLHLYSPLLKMTVDGIYIKTGILGDFEQYAIKAPISLIRSEIPPLIRPQEPIPPYPYIEEEVVFTNDRDHIQLAGTLTIPKGGGKFTGVVLISGSGAQNRDEEIMGHKPFKVIADYLTRKGIAVLRYDDRGVGKSQTNGLTGTTDDLSYDALAAVDYLKSREDISKVGLCGHSEGGTIAFIIASRDKKCDFVISLAGTGVRGDTILLSQQMAIGKTSGMDESSIEKVIASNRAIFNLITSSKDNDQLLKDNLIKMITASNPTMESDLVEKSVMKLINEWMYYFIRFSPKEAIRNTSLPILALNGTNDLQVIASLNLPAIQKAAQEGGNKNVTIKYLNGLNHLFQHSKTGDISEYSIIEETFSEEALSIIYQWITNL